MFLTSEPILSGARWFLQERSLHSQLPGAGVSHPARNGSLPQGGLSRRQNGRGQEACIWVTEEGAGIAWPPLLSQDL